MVVNTSEDPRASCMDARTPVDQLVTIERYSMLFTVVSTSIIMLSEVFTECNEFPVVQMLLVGSCRRIKS